MFDKNVFKCDDILILIVFIPPQTKFERGIWESLYGWSVCLSGGLLHSNSRYFVAQTASTVFKTAQCYMTHVTTIDKRFARRNFQNYRMRHSGVMGP